MFCGSLLVCLDIFILQNYREIFIDGQTLGLLISWVALVSFNFGVFFSAFNTLKLLEVTSMQGTDAEENE
jgi:hypothetical protein